MLPGRPAACPRKRWTPSRKRARSSRISATHAAFSMSPCASTLPLGSSVEQPWKMTSWAAIRFLQGSDVLMVPYVIHRHESFWDNPEAFDPDRFLPERVAERHRCAYVPFGGGPRALYRHALRVNGGADDRIDGQPALSPRPGAGAGRPAGGIFYAAAGRRRSDEGHPAEPSDAKGRCRGCRGAVLYRRLP